MPDDLLSGQLRRVNRVKLGIGLVLAVWLASLFLFRAEWVARLGGLLTTTPALSAPTWQQPALGAPLSVGDVSLVGQATPLTLVEAWLDGVRLAAASVSAEGEWRLTLPLSEPGSHTLLLRAVTGQDSRDAAPITLWLAPTPPGLNVPRTGLELTDGALTLNGLGTPQTRLAVWLDGQPAVTVPVGADGRWTATVQGVKPGQHDLQLRTLAADGQTWATRDILNAPIAAEFISPTVDAPLPNASLDGVLIVEGRGMPGAAVEILVDDAVLGQAPITADGSWRFSNATVAVGSHQLAVRGLDAQGRVRNTTAAQSFTLAPPFAPLTITATLTTPMMGEAITLSGRGQPAAVLDVLVNASSIATTTVDADGQWVYTPLTFSLPGDYQVGVQTLAPGDRLVASPLLSITVAPPPAVITPTLILPQGSATYVAGEQRLRGFSDPALTLNIVINDSLNVPVEVDAAGMWSKLVTFDPGVYTLVAVAQDVTGVEQARSAALTLTIVPTSRPTDCRDPVIYGIDRGDSYIVAPCESLSLIAQRVGLTPQAILAVNPTLSSPDNLQPGQLLNLPPRP